MIVKPKLFILTLGLLMPICVYGTDPLWTFTTPDTVLASPSIARDGTIYLASYNRMVYALTPNGTIKWTTYLPEPMYIYSSIYTAVYGTPAIGQDGTIYIPSENGILLAVDPATGANNWTYNTTWDGSPPQGLYSSPALAPDGTVYFGSYDQYLYAIYPNGTLKWRSVFDASIFGSPVVGLDTTVYCGSDDGKVYALNPSDGARKWTSLPVAVR